MHVVMERFPAFIPRALRGGHVPLEIPGIPGEPISHAMDLDLVLEFLEEFALAGLPVTLDELHDGHPVSLSQRAQGHAKSGGGFPFPVAGVDDDQPFFNGPLNALKSPRRFIDTS